LFVGGKLKYCGENVKRGKKEGEREKEESRFVVLQFLWEEESFDVKEEKQTCSVV